MILLMPSRASTSLLPQHIFWMRAWFVLCQCPHGLVPHCYAKGSEYFANHLALCQCPHGLVPHCYVQVKTSMRMSGIIVSMPSRASTSLLRAVNGDEKERLGVGCQCPHGLVPHCYSTPSKT